ncbi:N(G),N(G)-dimethylarginine dimethylaminohydrolase 1-like [Mya arenaria]|uniref:N(G),N(G)-dimethylarginine dimethylaminohydrolase 1-like n=1 Tax=Mya arenaria TaxID=6604 RepID=UPI0022E60C86|nr:N(G),N(G)-dimethylarginine dimethylaminohydrolase 1-like [Mya arenaria]XP_052789682.1 N(G),N(G)-dimethylarginine dimethylaminohydrolase 1-like [Mya arenaria]
MTTTRSTAFSYNYAIICRVPRSFAERGALAEGRQIDYEAARDEHRQLVDVLRKCSLNIIELQEDEDYKDCCCVEDCAVIIGGTALITRPGLKVRQGETKEIRRVLKSDLKLRIQEIHDGSATLDGGDVLFTGKEIFVGIGKNTNEAGAQAVAEAFPEYVVVPIYMEATKALHLKSLCSMAGRQVIAVSSSDCGTKIYRQIKQQAQFSYELLKLEDDSAANMIYLNGRLIHRTRDEMADVCWSVLDEKILNPRHQTSINELSKARVTLSSLVLLINKEKRARKLVSNLQDEDMDRYATIKTLK